MGVAEVLGRDRSQSLRSGSDYETDRAAAFRRLAEDELDRSYRLATVILGSAVEAQDAVHDAFEIAWRRWATLRDLARFEAWFGRIVINTCRNRVRRAHRWQIRDISEHHDLAVDDPTAPVADRVVIRRALDTLEPDDRIALALRYYQDVKVDDVAAAMGIRPRAASSRLHRALDEEEGREVVR